MVIAAGGSIARSICPGPRSGAPRPIRRWRESSGPPGNKAGRLDRQVPGGRFLFGVGGGWNGAFPRERRPVGGNRAPACQKRLGKSGAVGETGPFSERTVALSASEATIAGREPSKGRFGNYSDPQPEICLGRDALCTICWRDGMRSRRTGPVAARHWNVFEPAACPRRGRLAAGSHRTRRRRELDSNPRSRGYGGARFGWRP